MSKMVLHVSVSTGKVGSQVEADIPIESEDIEGIDEEDRAKYCDELLEQWVWDNVNAWSELREARP